ncbi:MAG: hypothetical protein PHQ81_11490 [Methanofollis sp.]|nr:hypothetical protein [Methanofollis sp.]
MDDCDESAVVIDISCGGGFGGCERSELEKTRRSSSSREYL